MKRPRPRFSRTDVENALFAGTPPRAVVFPFFGSCDERLKRFPFVVELDSRVFEDEGMQAHAKLARIVRAVGNSRVTAAELSEFFSDASPAVVGPVFAEAKGRFDDWQGYYYDGLGDYASTNTSKYHWEIAQSIGISAVMQPPFSSEQRAWIAYASSVHRGEDRKFFVEMFEAMKPWMNRDMWVQVEKTKEKKHDNAAFEDHREQMLRGSFGLPEGDKEIIARLEKEQATPVGVDDLDVIR